MRKAARTVLYAAVLILFASLPSQAQTLRLLAVGHLDGSRDGSLTDVSGLN